MFAYEKNGKLNIMVKGSKPASVGVTPDIVIQPAEVDSAVIAEVLINGEKVTAAAHVTVEVTAPNATVTPATLAGYVGDNVEFTVTAAEGYNVTKVEFNNTELTASQGIYTAILAATNTLVVTTAEG